MKAGFTLLEIMLACAILVVLAAVAIPTTSKLNAYAARMKSVANLRQIGVAARLYANEHNQQLPGQPAPSAGEAPSPGQSDPGEGKRWPARLVTYLTPSNPQLLVDPGDPAAMRLAPEEILSDTWNHTGYVYNGFDEFAVDQRPPEQVALTNLASPSEVVLLAQKTRGAGQFYVSPLLQPLANLLTVCNASAYGGGAYYLYVDGSVRFVRQQDYLNSCWLVDKHLTLPPLPLPPFRPESGSLWAGESGLLAPGLSLR